MTGILAAFSPGPATPPPPSVSLSNQFLAETSTGVTVSSYSVGSDGKVRDHNSFILESWLLGGGSAADYEVMATLQSGALTSGTTGSWLNCGTTRTWSVANGARNNTIVSAVIFVQIRRGTTIGASATITLSAESTNFN